MNNIVIDIVTNKIIIEGSTFYLPTHNQLEINIGSEDTRKWVNIVDEIVSAFKLPIYGDYPKLRVTVERIEDKEQNAPAV